MEQTITIGRGYSSAWVVEVRYARNHPTSPNQPVAGVYDGTETLTVVIADDDGAALLLSGTDATWLDPDAGTITLWIDDADTSPLGPKYRRLSIRLDDGGEPLEAFTARLRVEARPS